MPTGDTEVPDDDADAPDGDADAPDDDADAPDGDADAPDGDADAPDAVPCTFCGCDVLAHDPVFVAEQGGDGRVEAGRFCNYGCLVAHVEAEGLATGSTCSVEC